MGILNVTPDSFSDGGDFTNIDIAVNHAVWMAKNGADIIDIGGESTRPGAPEVSLDEELSRVIPVINGIKKKNHDIEISIDTTKYGVAAEAIKAGVDYINDISGLNFDPELARLAAQHNKWIILMHMSGTPQTMQNDPYYEDVVEEVFLSLQKKINVAMELGVKKLIADVGIGFGKNLDHNIALLKNHKKFTELKVPLLLGISRKSFIGKLLDIQSPKSRDSATALIHLLLINAGADIIRIHNVEIHNHLRLLYNIFS